MLNTPTKLSKLQKKAECSHLCLQMFRTYLESVEQFEASSSSEAPIEILLQGKPIERSALQIATNVAMLNSMYFYSRHKLELFKDEVRLALGQPSTSMAKGNKSEGSTNDKSTMGGAGSA